MVIWFRLEPNQGRDWWVGVRHHWGVEVGRQFGCSQWHCRDVKTLNDFPDPHEPRNLENPPKSARKGLFDSFESTGHTALNWEHIGQLLENSFNLKCTLLALARVFLICLHQDNTLSGIIPKYLTEVFQEILLPLIRNYAGRLYLFGEKDAVQFHLVDVDSPIVVPSL